MTGTGDEDFARYVGARWPALVRTTVLLGCPPDLAPDVVAAGLARCRRGWREATEHDDLEVVVHRAVLEAWTERLRGRWWAGLRPRTDADWPLPDLSDLDRLTPEVRAGLVLRRFAALDPAQAAAVAGRDAAGPLPARPDGPALVSSAEAVVVYAPPSAEELTDPRRRGPRALAAGAAAVAVVAGLVVWSVLAGGDDPDGESGSGVLRQVQPHRERNPAGVAWYAEDVLHLAQATYALPGVRDLAVMGAGAVYGDDRGRVVVLADDGTRTPIGAKNPSVPLVASDELGWVAWVDPTGPVTKLVVYDVDQAAVIGEVPIPPSELQDADQVLDTRPVAIDQRKVYVMTSRGAMAYRVLGGADPLTDLDVADLVDVASASVVYQQDPRSIVLKQPFFNEAPSVPGRGGALSDDGQYVWTHSPDDGSILVYDFDAAEPVDLPSFDGLSVVDVALAPPGSVTLLTVEPDGFAAQEGSDSRPGKGTLVTCNLRDGECESLATFVVKNDGPLLAR